ncbi:MAG: cardiolipin synthase [Lachnospiraceae bacterium]|nr:cardiolipin synthase [Lachnospiraceae bacterium]
MKSITYEKKASIKNGTGRMVVSLLVFLLEALFIVALFTWLNDYVLWVSFLTRVVSILIVLGLYASRMTSNIKTPWIILILAVPIVGVGIFLIVGLNGKPYAMRKRYQHVDAVLMPMLIDDEQDVRNEATFHELEQWDAGVASISNYIVNNSGYPLFHNSDITYYGSAEAGFAAQKGAMKAAKHFIFLEYHAIEDDFLWHSIQDILEAKVKEGVEVRVFYDDMGSIGFINTDFITRLAAVGIECRVFNPFVPGLNLFLNNRDHRKITVVDGVIGFTGGYNIANEYCNITHPFGKWKDTGVRIEGEAVRSLTITFMENWHAIRKSDGSLLKEEIARYLSDVNHLVREPGAFVQPYADTPLDDEQVGEEVYISIINNAKKYCWFITPYLIISDEMIHALNLAAKRGVDVGIVTPGIPDKKLVYSVTRSYYSALTDHGVRIYEWTPGFCHCKMCVSDDKVATCGTINLDYRSLYHHFENGCMYMNCRAVMDTKYDFENTFAEAKEVTEDYAGTKGMLGLGQQVLRLIAVLL